MKFLEKIQQILEDMGVKKSSDLSKEQKMEFSAKYKETHGTDLDADLAAYTAEKENQDNINKAFDMLVNIEGNNGENNGANAGQTPEQQVAAINQQIADLKKENGNKDAQILQLQKEKEALEKGVEPDNTPVAKVKINVMGMAHTDSHLFGADHAMYSRDKRWNKLMLDPSLSLQGCDERKTFQAFQDEVMEFGSKVHQRMVELHKKNLLRDPEKMQADINYDGLSNAGLGDQFVIRRTDALIARLVMLKNVFGIYPRRYGVQDRELITNAFFGEFSQPYQEGEVWKGDMTLEPEMGYVDDGMMKTLFKNWKWIERRYIGYLNQDGSDPVKWNMIEWAVLHIGTVLTNEQYKRKILGIFRKPIASRPAHALHASTGTVYTLIRYYHEHKLLPMDDTFSTYTNTGTDMIDTVEAFVEAVKEKYEGDIDDLELHLNKNHKTWYKAGYRQKYGADGDFTSVVDGKLQDENVNIVWVPNMGSLTMMIMQKPGNIQCLEYLPGEMYKIQFDPEMESVKAWSMWKEGTSAAFVGKPFNSHAELVANDYKLQEIFMNKPASDAAVDSSTLDVGTDFWKKTVENTVATNITDLQNAKEGVGYIVECGNVTNASTITNTGKFSTITAAYVPTAVGDNIMLVFDATDDKFYELERTVAGVRTINKALQPNAPGNGGR